MAENQNTDVLTGSIDDYLLAVADGIHQAQLQLSQMRVPALPGQQAVMYQLPRVDFEFKMSFEISTKSGNEGSGVALRARPLFNESNTTAPGSELG